MQSNKKTKLNFFYLAILFATISFQACQDAETQILTLDDQLIMEYLEEINAPTEHVDLNSDFIGYHDCSGWHKEDLLNIIKGIDPENGDTQEEDIFKDASGEELDSRQRGIADASRWSALTAGNVQSIDYFIHPSVAADCGTAWRSAAVNAANAWNNLAHSRVNLRRVWSAGSADIEIGSDRDAAMPGSHRNLAGTTIARAGFPRDGRAWRFISINDNADNWNSKMKTMMHEYGHCLGYRHTNTNDGQQIPGTAVTDNNSIMNQGRNTNPSWTANDERAIRLYYPQRLDRPTDVTVTSPSRGRARIRLRNPARNSRPYYWVRVLRYSTAGAYLGTTYRTGVTDNNGFINIDWTVPSGRFRFQVEGQNFRRDVRSSRSSTVTATIR